ncbi:hypothetical protein GCM10007392_18140 [Saccharospirillum salsuginis]|uniref:Uncharacterized protein n=1 Tax=Saccharospirillum salsuginis TaxID=418750 RepID=A0A918K8F0_9GAMM|nr:hypothetical protein GCM10007392_18140 [Saccharospirillum salsuginis]
MVSVGVFDAELEDDIHAGGGIGVETGFDIAEVFGDRGHLGLLSGGGRDDDAGIVGGPRSKIKRMFET